MNKPSLRDIKREATTKALASAAFELAVERGLDGFIIDDLVQRAGYSRKTFANHFSCKEEAIAMAAILTTDHYEDEPLNEIIQENILPLDALYVLIKRSLTTEYVSKMRQLVSLSTQYPTLEPYLLSVLSRLQATAQETLTDLSQGRYPQGYSHLLSGAVYGAVLAIFDGSINVLLPGQGTTDSPGEMTLDQYLYDMFNYLRSGF
ncbi:TetR/AcrR family transcriptional regulator [Paenibacillus sp. BIC5C1]|uniref:TetR/AcrR family transcriptional regulator n=1 Tax=Paenibacillus sp. BIC5C1 TaxID=3078263 RepID=UPI0028E8AC65|nr:TetR/AcrR family transcriptional regulator [Paenibacillus sp. BIC5C1]